MVDVLSQSYVVEAGKSIQVHAVVTLSEADRAYLAEHYANGCYVEGFIYATDPDGAAAELLPAHAGLLRQLDGAVYV